MASTEFSLAQQRLAARRRVREEAPRSQDQPRERISEANQQLSRLPWPLGYLGRTGSSAWGAIKGREGTRPAFRVGQVDAELLDEELLDLLKGQAGEAFKYLGSRIQDDWSAEILLAIRAMLFKLTIWDHNATYGAALQNLQFTDARRAGPSLESPTRWQKGLYGLFTVGGKYAWTKWEDWLTDNNNGYSQSNPYLRRLAKVSDSVTSVHSVAAFISFLVFLTNGRYRTLLDRVLRLRLAPPSSQVSRQVSFEYLNRQLLWHAMTEFLLFMLPLVGVNRWRKWLARAWRKAKSLVRNADDDLEEKDGEYNFLPERTCAICYQDRNVTMSKTETLSAGASGMVGSAQTDITNPYETIPCSCLYCFVCLASRLEAEDGEAWICLRCGNGAKECKPWSGDVIEQSSKPALIRSSKSVDFTIDSHKAAVVDTSLEEIERSET